VERGKQGVRLVGCQDRRALDLKAPGIDRIKATRTDKLKKSLAVHFSELKKEI